VLLFTLASPLHAQDLYWEDPEFLPAPGGRFPQAKAGGDLMVLVWQEVVPLSEGRGRTYLSLKSSKDGVSWHSAERFAGPYDFVGNATSIFSLTVDRKGVILLSVLAAENTIELLRSEDGGRNFSKSLTKTTLNTTLAPRLFAKDDGGYLLFVTQERNDILSLFYTVSADGSSWADLKPLVTEPDLTLSFLPHHTSFGGREYVVFQALRTGEGGAYQLFLRISDDGGESWGPLRWITGFEEILPGRTARPDQFDNQRPHIEPINGNLGVAWERKFGREAKQIYYMEILPGGEITGVPERVTTGFRIANFPQILRYRDVTYLLWFDNRKGDDHIILAYKQGFLWAERDLSAIPGISTFGRPVLHREGLYIFWENRRGDSSRLVFLKPDTTARAPEIIPLNFQAGRRSRDDTVRFRWNLPNDSSGIAGFSYQWSRDKTPNLPKTLMVPEIVRTREFTAGEDGPWYFHLAAQDFAGNWSPPVTMTYYRDRTPPGPVVFQDPERDELGSLVSNSFFLKWESPPDEDVVGYTYNFQYVGESRDPPPGRTVALPPPPRAVLTTERAVGFQNHDNGLWALNVSAVDQVGNIGPPTALFVHLNKYIPVTYITFVDAVRNEVGTINLNILGRGFAAEGLISEVVIDRDGAAPFDYVFPLRSGTYSVRSDRTISGPALTEIADGTYRIGVRHPLRGYAFARDNFQFESTGTIKFGDFTIVFRPSWRLGARAPIFLSGNALTVWIIVVFLACIMLFSILRIGALVNEGRRLRLEAIALVRGEAEHWAKKQERIRAMKKQGIGLRIKFTLFITVLVIAVVLMVSIPLGFYMTANEERNLADGLSRRVAVLIESLAAGARTYLPGGNTLELGILPSQISAMSEARFATITGRGVNDLTSYGHVWASNDGELSKKIDNDTLIPGVSKLNDDISPKEAAFAADINSKAQGAVSDIARELDQLAGEAIRLAVRTDRESQLRLTDLQNNIRTLDTRLNDQLSAIGAEVGSEPPFSTERLDFDVTSYTFYKPVLYRTRGDNTYYRGLVRLNVSTESILRQVRESRENLVLITGIIALIALVVGVIGALILASITIIPIKRLVRGVETIRDTEDKEKLKEHIINVKTRDEIALLADTINQMTQGLVRAAAASKDLTVGKEIQKMFIPLEVGSGGKKFTTGKTDTPDAEFFGYYEGAKGVSGDYFDFRKLDNENYAFIKCDVAGKGVPAALIMVEVATIFITYFKDWKGDKGLNMVALLYQINDLLEAQGFKGRFAAMTLGVFNSRTGRSQICHAGDRILNLYEAGKKEFTQRMMADCPATGVFPNFMVEMKSPFEQIIINLKPGDINMLFTDGVEEAHRKLRKPNFEILQIPSEKEGEEPIEDEMLGPERIKVIIEAVMNRKSYRLEKENNPVGDENLLFDFSWCEPTAENAVMAMVAVEKIFRMYPSPRAGANNRVMIDIKVDEFLKKSFKRYDGYFHHPVDNPNTNDFPNYNFYTHIMEDDQYDDLTLLAIRKK
jgi:methyl-accepting chemotaxis protein